MTALSVFISHSARDHVIAARLIDLLRDALNLPASDVRCTSVDGYRLPAGVPVEQQLRHEVQDATVFVGMVSRDSVRSAYVLFELGARWGASRSLLPLLVAGAQPSILAGPMAGLNALSCDSRQQVLQLVSDVSRLLSREANPPYSYAGKVDALVEASHTQARVDASLVAILDGRLTGEMRDLQTNETRAFVVFPVRLLNEAIRAITPEFFSLSAKIADRNIPFLQMRIPSNVEWRSDHQHIALPDADKLDLSMSTKSIMPGEAVVGYLMFASAEVSNHQLANVSLDQLAFQCTDIRGLVHEIVHVERPPNVPGIQPRLQVAVASKHG